MKKVGKIGAVYVWQSGNLIPVKGQFLIHGKSKKIKLAKPSKSVSEKARPSIDENQNRDKSVTVSTNIGEIKDGAK